MFNWYCCESVMKVFLKLRLQSLGRIDNISWKICRVSIRKTYAQFLRNETQNFSFLAHQFCAKKKTTTICAIIRKSHFAQIALFRFSETKVLRNSATRVLPIPQFRKNQTVGDGACFLEFNSSSAGRFCTKIRNRLSSKSLDNFSFGHAYFLKSGFFRHWLLPVTKSLN